MVHYLKEDVGDLRQFIGMSVNEIVERLSILYPTFIYVPSGQVFQTFEKDPYYNYIQYELDYPMNLAGFIRQNYIHQINYYIRSKFNRLIIRNYFQYILTKKYNNVIDTLQMEYYINQQMSKLDDEHFTPVKSSI